MSRNVIWVKILPCDKTEWQRWLQHWPKTDLLLSSGQTFDYSDEETVSILLSPAFTSSAVYYFPDLLY